MTTWQGMLHDMNCYDMDHELLRFKIGSEGVRPSTNFYLDVLWWISIWIGSDECESGHGHLKGHIDDDPREGRGLIFLRSCYVGVCARWRILAIGDFMRIDMHYKEMMEEWGSMSVLELEWLLCRELGHDPIVKSRRPLFTSILDFDE